METKLSKLKAAMAAGDEVAALRIAAKFPRLGEDKVDIQRAWAAHTSPDMYQDMGYDPAELFRRGIDAIRSRYGI